MECAYTALPFPVFRLPRQLSVISSLGKVENEGAPEPAANVDVVGVLPPETTCKGPRRKRLAGTLMATLVSNSHAFRYILLYTVYPPYMRNCILLLFILFIYFKAKNRERIIHFQLKSNRPS